MCTAARIPFCGKTHFVVPGSYSGVLENREPYYFITICRCKQGPLSLFSYQMLASILTIDKRSSYYKVYDRHASLYCRGKLIGLFANCPIDVLFKVEG